ncbi:hypothetical protein LCGC14_2327850 [marine sediment metagenome]|uniref:Uncharacterized protein n=1 Tax=marine sediment metagenome TaxID=412755 RepID=A0A0F9D397_9ZZZZ
MKSIINKITFCEYKKIRKTLEEIIESRDKGIIELCEIIENYKKYSNTCKIIIKKSKDKLLIEEYNKAFIELRKQIEYKK